MWQTPVSIVSPPWNSMPFASSAARAAATSGTRNAMAVELLENSRPIFSGAKTAIEAWRVDYNTVRPHSSLDGATPEQFARIN